MRDIKKSEWINPVSRYSLPSLPYVEPYMDIVLLVSTLLRIRICLVMISVALATDLNLLWYFDTRSKQETNQTCYLPGFFVLNDCLTRKVETQVDFRSKFSDLLLFMMSVLSHQLLQSNHCWIYKSKLVKKSYLLNVLKYVIWEKKRSEIRFSCVVTLLLVLLWISRRNLHFRRFLSSRKKKRNKK